VLIEREDEERGRRSPSGFQRAFDEFLKKGIDSTLEGSEKDGPIHNSRKEMEKGSYDLSSRRPINLLRKAGKVSVDLFFRERIGSNNLHPETFHQGQDILIDITVEKIIGMADDGHSQERPPLSFLPAPPSLRLETEGREDFL
jgi:hypothetical protein